MKETPTPEELPTRRLLQDDEEEARRRYEEGMEQLRKAEEKMKGLAEDKTVGEAKAGESEDAAKKPIKTMRLSKKRKRSSHNARDLGKNVMSNDAYQR